MIGKNQLEIGKAQFSAGMSSSDYVDDGGYSPDNSYNLNPLISRGAIRPGDQGTDLSTNIADTVIAKANESVGSEYLLVGDAAKFYKFVSPSTAPTVIATGAQTTKYRAGITDAVYWAGQYLVSWDTDIAKVDASLTTLTESWWQGTKGQSPLTASVAHQFLIYQRLCWVSDKRYLHTIAEDGTPTSQVLDLGNRAQINALGIDPGTGNMLISTTELGSGIYPWSELAGPSFVYLFDGYSSKPRRQIPTESAVTAFYNVGGNVFVGYGVNNLGLWNGNGITHLRKLDYTATAYTTASLYKHKMTSVDNVLYYVDGNKVIGFGEILVQGKRSFFPFWRQDVSGTGNISALFNVTDSTNGNKKLGVTFAGASSTYKFYAVSTNSSIGNGIFQSNRMHFPRPVYIRRIRVFTTGVSDGDAPGSLSAFTETGVTDTAFITGSFSNNTGATKYLYEFDCGNKLLNQLQLQVNWSLTYMCIVRIVVYYDIAE